LRVSKLSCGWGNTAVVTTTNDVYCWGSFVDYSIDLISQDERRGKRKQTNINKHKHTPT